MALDKNVPADTKFASSARSDFGEIKTAKDAILSEEFFVAALNAFPDIVLVLNENRQIVYANDKLTELLGITCVDDVLGKRPGEAVNCVRSLLEAGGCGTSEFCRECGAVRAILLAQKGQVGFQECRMTVRVPGGEAALDLRVWAGRISIHGRTFIFFTIKDISDEKRREILEQTFFHDVLNEAGILAGYSENMRDGLVPPAEKPAEQMFKYTQRIIEAIQEQQDLLNAERRMFVIRQETFPIHPFLLELISFYQQHRLARNRQITLDCPQQEILVTTDKSLLRRVLGNLIKNALEATAEKNAVRVRVQEESGKKIFSVHNPESMPRSIQLQMFQRSFSTKGKGRGIGTYSVKLFTEQYLKGKVWLESEDGKGTTFFVRV